MKTKNLLLLAILLVTSGLAFGQDIEIRVSVKVIVDPATGQAPATMSDALLRQSFTDINLWLANTGRGYRVRAVNLDASQNFKRIGSSDLTGPSKWYTTNLKDDYAANLQFEIDAKANTLYAWNSSAINIYFNNSNAYSAANFPWDGRDLVVSAYALLTVEPDPGQTFARSYKVAGNLLHEIGHYMGLLHTFHSAGDDEIADTALDPQVNSRNETLVRNSIAQLNFCMDYSSLTTSQRTLVDNTANNAMSYYQLFYDVPPDKVLTEEERFGPTRFIFTEQQMDRWARYANAERAVVTTGLTRFVSLGGVDSNTGLLPGSPKRTVLSAINASSSGGGDIVLLRPGNYNEQLNIQTPVTLRATRAGTVTIGQP